MSAADSEWLVLQQTYGDSPLHQVSYVICKQSILVALGVLVKNTCLHEHLNKCIDMWQESYGGSRDKHFQAHHYCL